MLVKEFLRLKMKLTIRNNIEISSGLSPPEKKALTEIINNLTFENPEYAEAVRFRRFARGIQKTIKSYKIVGNSVFIPRGFLKGATSILDVHGLQYEVEYDLPNFPPVKIESKIKLRSYQEPFVDALMRSNEGIGVAAPGAGKTSSALEYASRRGLKTLWITHTSALANQTTARIHDFLNVDSVGFIGGGKEKHGDITVALVQSLVNKNLESEEYRSYGTVIVDECFVAGTMVSGKSIETIRVGDYVESYDELTGRFVEKKVTKVFKSIPETLIEVCLSGPTFFCTYLHPILTESGWKPAIHLNRGDRVVGKNKILVCSGVCPVEKNEYDSFETFYCPDGFVYNLEVEDTHTYIANGVVVHNCHHAPSNIFREAAGNLAPKYLLGLSATPYRKDGLQELMFQYIGPILYSIDKSIIVLSGEIIPAKIIQKETPAVVYKELDDYQSIMKEVYSCEDRTMMIAGDVVAEASEGHTCIVLTATVDYGREIASLINNIGIPAEIVFSTEVEHDGKPLRMSKKEREKTINRFLEGEFKVLVATFKFLSEGFDHRPLSRLFLASPISDKNRTLLEQVCGRVERAFPGKKDALVFDYVDNHSLLRYQAKNRICVYEENGMEVISRIF